jgi:hypothetical protein
MVTVSDIVDGATRAERRRRLRAARKSIWASRVRPNGLPSLRYPRSEPSSDSVMRSKYWPHIGAKQRRKGLVRLARANVAIAAE